LLLDKKIIRQEKDWGKEKSKSKVKETKGVFFSIQAEIENTSLRALVHSLSTPAFYIEKP